MSTIITRAGKGSALTHNEVDANFNNLNTDKAEKTVANTFTANQIVSVTDNANAALRITQLGTGNALLVEDSTNPDASPFVIDQLGKINVGSLVQYAMTPATPYSQWNSADNQYASIGLTSWQAGTNTQSKLIFGRGDSSIVGDFSNAVDSGDNLGSVHWNGSDGTAFVEAASISASVDGTPGTNDMPGRLVFSTTADGASTPTERMRINSAGNVGIGSTPQAGRTFTVEKAITGAIGSYAQINSGAIQSDVTTAAYYYSSYATTSSSNFTIGQIVHYNVSGVATFPNVTAGGAVTNQYGFNVGSSLTGATNNYGFYGNIASGTGRYNLYMNGTAANQFNGDLTVYGATAIPAGGTTGSGYKLSSTANFGIFFGSGAPTLSAAKGSLYLRSDGTTTNNRMYVNTDGATTWTAVTTAA